VWEGVGTVAVQDRVCECTDGVELQLVGVPVDVPEWDRDPWVALD